MNRINKDKLFTLFLWAIILVTAVGIVLYLIWSSVYRVEPKVVSILNYYNFPVEVSFLNHTENYQPFEVKNYDVNRRDDFTVITKKQDGTELSTIQVRGLKLPAELVEIVLSETKDYCYFNANTTSLYNSDPDQINQVNILSKNPSDYFIFGISENTFNVYPKSNKPTEEDTKFRQIKGYYPIKCGLANDSKEIEKVVKTYIDYDYQAQIDYYNQKKVQIQNTTDEETLNGI